MDLRLASLRKSDQGSLLGPCFTSLQGWRPLQDIMFIANIYPEDVCYLEDLLRKLQKPRS